MSSNSKARAQFIFATILLDALGIGLLIPILPDIIRRFSAEPEFVSRYFGYFISSYALIQFFASPVLGSLSDRYGRRPVLLVSLLGAGADYIVMAFAPNLAVLFLGRAISGLTGASMTVASAYMADVSDDKNRSANFGLIGAGWGVGFILGPALGGVIGSFGWIYPFLAAAALNLLNFAFGFFILPESLPPEKRRPVSLKSMNPLKSVFQTLAPSPISLLVWIYALLFLAGQVHPSTWTLYTQFKFGWSSFDVGMSLAVVGISIAVAQGYLTRVIIPRLGEWRSLIFGTFVYAAGYAGFALATQGWMMYAVLVPSALSGVAVPALQSMIAKKTPPDRQGELQGSLVGIGSLTAIGGPLLFTALFAEFTRKEAPLHLPGASYLAAALICAIAGLMLAFVKRDAEARPG